MRTCEVCGEPLPVDAHYNRKMHSDCAQQRKRETGEQWKKQHPDLQASYLDKHKKTHERWEKEHRERHNETSRRWGAAHPDKRREINRRYRSKHNDRH